MLNYRKAGIRNVLVSKLASIITEINTTLDSVSIDYEYFPHDMITGLPAHGLCPDNIEQSKAIMAQMTKSIEVAAQRAGLLSLDSNIFPAS